jgi:hypothetical protein
MMGPGMMHGMMEGMMRGMAEGLARGLIEGMAAAHGMEPGVGPARGMGPEAMGRHGMMMGGRGMGPALLYGAPGDLSVERVTAMIEGHLVWHGNPRLKLGEIVEQEDGTIVAEILTVDDSLVQRLAVDPASGVMHQLP